MGLVPKMWMPRYERVSRVEKQAKFVHAGSSGKTDPLAKGGFFGYFFVRKKK
jgi:hypothetical protein